MNAYIFIIGLCVVIIISFFCNVLARRTNIPSVLILIFLGVGIQQLLNYLQVPVNFYNTLEVLGIVGLIMIVLEAALDLRLSREKWPIIWKSFTIAALSLGLTSIAISFVIRLLFPGLDFVSSMVYALPLSIMSSAIIIPSVAHITSYKREFLIYESTFSDILGIMVFYMIVENVDVEGMRQLSFAIGGNIIVTIVTSVVLSYILLYVIQNIRGEAKFFLFLAVMVLLYAIGKLFHLSSLIIILMFGLLLRNYRVLLFWKLREWLDDSKIAVVFDQFKMITIETSFLVRTFFFVVFGMTLPLITLTSWRVWLVSIIFLVITYSLRYALFYVIERKDTMPQTFIAPKGLISILLFIAIPESLKSEGIENGVLFVVIISTSIIMAWSLISHSKRDEIEGDTEEDNGGNYEGNEPVDLPLNGQVET